MIDFGFDKWELAVDGTTQPWRKVLSFDNEICIDWKFRYSVLGLVTCNWSKKVINVIWNYTDYVHIVPAISSVDLMIADKLGKCTFYFRGNKYGIEDAALGPSMRFIPRYRAP